MKKYIIIIGVLILSSCSFKMPKSIKMKDGMDEVVNVPIISTNIENIKEVEFNKIIESIENKNPCKHEGSFKPKNISIYNTNDTIMISMSCMCQNSFGVYGDVNTYVKLDKNFEEIENVSF